MNAYSKQYYKENKKEISERRKLDRLGSKKDHIRARDNKYRESTIRAFLSHKFSHLKKEKHHNKTSNKCKLSVTLEYLLKLWENQNGKCAISGKVMSHKKNDLFGVSIDRIDSNFGYLEGNIQLVCQGLNFAKNKYTDCQIRYFWYNNS